MPVWRVGHYSAPCDFPPRYLYAWVNRFDDSMREYRTLYCADEKETCLRELLADLSPNAKAISEFKRLFGSAEQPFGKVTQEWRQKNVLAQAEIDLLSGDLAEIESISVRNFLETRLAGFLRQEGVKDLDIRDLRGKKRHMTQRLSRELFDEGRAGIKFRSYLDHRPCYALFEFRARLNQIGEALPLQGDLPELMAVCKELSLTL